MSIDRQYGTSLGEIRPDHVERYKFAQPRVRDMVTLDAACGCGYGAFMIAADVAIDIEPEALEYAQKHWWGPLYLQADLTKFRAYGFDAIVSFETIEHLEDPKPFLTQNDASLLICSVPNELQAPFRAEAFTQDKYPHRRHYTPDQFEELLFECGWQVRSKHSQKTKFSPVEPGTDGMYLIYECVRLNSN